MFHIKVVLYSVTLWFHEIQFMGSRTYFGTTSLQSIQPTTPFFSQKRIKDISMESLSALGTQSSVKYSSYFDHTTNANMGGPSPPQVTLRNLYNPTHSPNLKKQKRFSSSRLFFLNFGWGGVRYSPWVTHHILKSWKRRHQEFTLSQEHQHLSSVPYRSVERIILETCGTTIPSWMGMPDWYWLGWTRTVTSSHLEQLGVLGCNFLNIFFLFILISDDHVSPSRSIPVPHQTEIGVCASI